MVTRRCRRSWPRATRRARWTTRRTADRTLWQTGRARPCAQSTRWRRPLLNSSTSSHRRRPNERRHRKRSHPCACEGCPNTRGCRIVRSRTSNGDILHLTVRSKRDRGDNRTLARLKTCSRTGEDLRERTLDRPSCRSQRHAFRVCRSAPRQVGADRYGCLESAIGGNRRGCGIGGGVRRHRKRDHRPRLPNRTTVGS